MSMFRIVLYFYIYDIVFCSHFDMEKVEKGPKEIFNPEIQKELLVLEEQEVRPKLNPIKNDQILNNM